MYSGSQGFYSGSIGKPLYAAHMQAYMQRPFYSENHDRVGYSSIAIYTGTRPVFEDRVSAHSSATELFLRPFRPACQFIDEARGIMDSVVSAFLECTGYEFPDDVVIRVCSPDEMTSRYEGWHPGVLGFAFNRLGFGISEIFLLKNQFDSLLVTAGHEIGHVLSFPAPSRVSEEAKAFAFEAAWLKALVEKDIGGLRGSINLGVFSPAINGVHDVAFGIVKSQILSGRSPLELYADLARGKAMAI